MRCGADTNTSDITAARLPCVLFSSCSSVSGKGSRDDQWDAFFSEFPVTIGALAPSKDKRNLSVPGLVMNRRPISIGGESSWKSVCYMSPVGTGLVFVKQILYAVCEELLSVSL